MSTNPPAIILGGHYGALPIARSLGARGVSVYCHDRSSDAIALQSRYVRPFCIGASSHELMAAIRKLESEAGAKPVVFVTADAFLTFLEVHFDELSQHAVFPYRDATLIGTLVDKRKTANLFDDRRVPTPQTVAVTGHSFVDAMRIPVSCILKPLVQTDWTANSEVMSLTDHRKVLRPADMVDALTWIEKLHAYGPMVAQQYIPGGDGDIFYYVGYRHSDGRHLVSFTGRKLRTLDNSMGSETLLSNHQADDIGNLGKQVLDKLGIVGPAGVDIKRDPNTGEMQVIEVNYRFGLSDGILKAAGIDLPLIYYRDAIDGDVPSAPTAESNAVWVWLEPELRMGFRSWRRLLSTGLSLFQAAMKGRVCINEFSIVDPRPGLQLFSRRTVSYFKGRLGHA